MKLEWKLELVLVLLSKKCPGKKKCSFKTESLNLLFDATTGRKFWEEAKKSERRLHITDKQTYNIIKGIFLCVFFHGFVFVLVWMPKREENSLFLKTDENLFVRRNASGLKFIRWLCSTIYVDENCTHYSGTIWRFHFRLSILSVCYCCYLLLPLMSIIVVALFCGTHFFSVHFVLLFYWHLYSYEQLMLATALSFDCFFFLLSHVSCYFTIKQ